MSHFLLVLLVSDYYILRIFLDMNLNNFWEIVKDTGQDSDSSTSWKTEFKIAY